jgi:hypothetical protein
MYKENNNSKFGSKKRLRFYLPLIGIGILCMLLLALFMASRNQSGSNAPAENNPAFKVGSAFDAAEYLSGFGWDISGEPSSVRNVEIPAEFTAAYEEYNKLQKAQGFDLAGYRTKTATVYTFRVLNHHSPDEVFANILVHEGEVIAGDLVSYALDGFLTGLKPTDSN